MSWHIRPASLADLPALMDLAALTGGGFTNLPHDERALAERLAWSDESFARAEDAPDNELYILLLEHTAHDGAPARIGGSAMVFSRIGVEWPFYSYKLATLSHQSRELGRSFALPFLSLVTDHDGASEVGGLFLHPDLRTGGLGRLLARSRYLFIAQHRARFGPKLLAELRGVLDDAGNSPFWDALGARFFGMPFPEADAFNAINGNQFIADLMPKHPIYTALLTDEARAVIGQPHPKGRAAMAMLEAEGFAYDNYVDIFDGGPTMTVRTDQVRTLRESRAAPIARACGTDDVAVRSLIAHGVLRDFRCWLGLLARDGGHSDGNRSDGGVAIPAGELAAMGLGPGDEVRHVDL